MNLLKSSIRCFVILWSQNIPRILRLYQLASKHSQNLAIVLKINKARQKKEIVHWQIWCKFEQRKITGGALQHIIFSLNLPFFNDNNKIIHLVRTSTLQALISKNVYLNIVDGIVNKNQLLEQKHFGFFSVTLIYVIKGEIYFDYILSCLDCVAILYLKQDR